MPQQPLTEDAKVVARYLMSREALASLEEVKNPWPRQVRELERLRRVVPELQRKVEAMHKGQPAAV